MPTICWESAKRYVARILKTLNRNRTPMQMHAIAVVVEANNPENRASDRLLTL